jgi:hypothetical protein
LRGSRVTIWFGAALAAVALLGGGLLFGGLVSAQEPTPEVTEEVEPATPDATEEAAPEQDAVPEEDTERSKGECDHEADGAEGDSTGVRFRGGDDRTFAQ